MEAVWGEPPAALARVAGDAVQVSPLIIGSTPIEGLADAALDRCVLAAPPGTLERGYALAHALRALRTGGDLVALAPKQRGGARLRAELEGFGCVVAETARRHQRICRAQRPGSPTGIEAAIAAGAPRWIESIGLHSQPGIFSWDRIDPGSAQLLAHLDALAGTGADLGCGAGVLARATLARPAVTRLTLVDIDRRALDAARRNIDDPRARFLQHDLRHPPAALHGLDFAIMNPPFHDGGAEDRALGLAFVAAAAALLKPGGRLIMVANVALPYERALAEAFAASRIMARAGGYKVLEGLA
jgi:16S rRNA (guanine1207-N2)-methyltransferase